MRLRDAVATVIGLGVLLGSVVWVFLPEFAWWQHVCYGTASVAAIALAGLNKDQAADAMGYTSASSVSRWISNQEPPNLSRLWAAEELRAGLVAALAEHAGDRVEVQTTVIVRRTA